MKCRQKVEQHAVNFDQPYYRYRCVPGQVGQRIYLPSLGDVCVFTKLKTFESSKLMNIDKPISAAPVCVFSHSLKFVNTDKPVFAAPAMS